MGLRNKKNAIPNLNNNESDIDKVHVNLQDPYEYKYQYFISKEKFKFKKYFDNLNSFIEFSNKLQILRVQRRIEK